ncbi:MAG: hypothetical protein NTU44_02150 [Bacteroidetes bacterium]|nr:hypothetical protein [Bacteroidota bacterium]
MNPISSAKAWQYQTPEFTVILIDKEISLVMMTTNGGGGAPSSPEFNSNKKEDKDEKNAFDSPFEK